MRSPPSFVVRAFLLAGLVAAIGPVFGAEATDSMRERVLRMTEFLDTMLPGTLGPRNMTLSIKPKFSDLRDNEYVRYPLELRYGVSEHWELLGGLTPFGPNPLNGGADHRWGPGEVKLGARYDLVGRVAFFDATTVGFEARIPVGKPPVELNDHYTHVRPFITASRTLNHWPSTRFYANLSYDRSVELTHRGEPPPQVMRRNIIEAAPGLLFKPGQLGYFAEYRYRHITEEHEWHLAHEVQFGTIWDVPLARTAAWKLPGKWQLEFAYKVNHEEGRGSDQGVAARVNWRTTLREMLTGNANKSASTRR